MPRRRRPLRAYRIDCPPAAGHAPANRCRALILIDSAPLQAAAWSELLRARQRLEKATRDIHRHEEADTPAFRSWLVQTFPVLLSAVRELVQQIEAKGRLVQAVQSEAFFTGRAPGPIWRAWQANGGQPPPPPPGHPDSEPWGEAGAGAGENGHSHDPDIDDRVEKEINRLFEEEGIPDDDPFARDFQDFARGIFGVGSRRPDTPESAGARDVYRRLVRHLHPDAGGKWTPARARVWEQVQEAWNARDADWLARLEAEWEASADLLGPTSPLGRLRAALVEIDAARRDAEKRVREYRKDDAWRFSLQPATDKLRARIHEKLRHDEAMLRDQLGEIEALIAQWERAGRGRRSRKKRTSARQFDLF
jgi:hypothetical protein